jgi:uncharacterized integral membrane protein (TIGR00697 family)
MSSGSGAVTTSGSGAAGRVVPAASHGADDPSAMDVRARVYLWLAAIFVTSLLLANIVGVKLFRFEIDLGELGMIPIEHTIGMLPFPITFLLTDLLNEYYGKRGARRVAYLAFAMGALGFVMIWVARAFPTLEGIPGTATRESFENIFGAASLMYLASLGAFLIGSMLDISLFGLFKRATGGRLVWLRATGSTVISQLFDSLLVTFFFFWLAPVILDAVYRSNGSSPLPATAWIIQTALTGYILKFVIAVAMTPLIYAGRAFLRVRFGLVPVPAESA